MNIQSFKDKEELANAATEFIGNAANKAIEQRGIFTLAISGGSTPRRMLELLSRKIDDLDWSRVHLFQVDERIAPDGHDDRNATMLDDCLLTPEFQSKHTPKVWLMPVNQTNPESIYLKQVESVCGQPAVFDLVQLGLGGDGHTASLVPGDPVCNVVDRDFATSAQYQGRLRLTMTRPILERAREQLWLVAGSGKQTAVRQLLDGDPSIPANLFTHRNATLMCDVAALPPQDENVR